MSRGRNCSACSRSPSCTTWSTGRSGSSGWRWRARSPEPALVHGAFGIIGLALARTVTGARGFLVGGGLIYLLLWLYGLFIDHGSGANFIPVNHADNWLHLGLGVGMVLLGLLLPPRRQPAPAGRHTAQSQNRPDR